MEWSRILRPWAHSARHNRPINPTTRLSLFRGQQLRSGLRPGPAGRRSPEGRSAASAMPCRGRRARGLAVAPAHPLPWPTVSGLHARCPGVRGIGALESVSTSGHHHFRACLNPERYPFQPFRIPQSLAALPSGSIVARFRPSSWIVTIIFCFTIMYPVFFLKKRNLQR